MTEEIEKKIVKQLLNNSDYVDFINSHDEYFWKGSLLNLIADAPVSLYEKRDLLKLLSEQECESNLSKIFTRHYNQLEEAIDNLTVRDKEIFAIKMVSIKNGDENPSCLTPARSLDEAFKAILLETDCSDEAELIALENQQLLYCNLDKYDFSSGQCVYTYNYELLGLTPVWFSKILDPKSTDSVLTEEGTFSSVPAIVLPCPYKPGDVVKLDCRPHAPVEYAVILCNPKSQMRDCCSPWVIYINKDGDYDMGALNHNAPVREYNAFAMSCLYRIEKISSNELPKEREGLRLVSEFIAGSEENGRYLDNYPFNGPVSPRHMKWAIEEYGKHNNLCKEGTTLREKAYAYWHGDGVKVDVKKALEICAEAETIGYSDCYLLQAQIYDYYASGETGEIYNTNIALAEKYFIKAGENNDILAVQWLMDYYWDPDRGNNKEEAVYWRDKYLQIKPMKNRA